MKQRLLVMNGQKIVQNEQGAGKWQTESVDKAWNVKPGIYNIYQAKAADKSATHTGVILHADKNNIYQQIGREFVQHKRSDFDKVPDKPTDVGATVTVAYSQDTGRANVSAPTQAISRGVRR
jgi:cell filamentation protein